MVRARASTGKVGIAPRAHPSLRRLNAISGRYLSPELLLVPTPYSRRGAEGGVDFLVMEFIEGSTLEARIKEGPFKLSETIRIGKEIADGLKAT